jgi:hypothetical protein
MQRSKNLALMFLLGAVLVGGALGFTADRVIVKDRMLATCNAPRPRLYDQLGLTAAQRASMDSILDDRRKRFDEVLNPVRPQLESIRENARNQMRALLDSKQRDRFEQILAEQQRQNDKRGNHR